MGGSHSKKSKEPSTHKNFFNFKSKVDNTPKVTPNDLYKDIPELSFDSFYIPIDSSPPSPSAPPLTLSRKGSTTNYDQMCCVCLDDDDPDAILEIACRHLICKHCYPSIVERFNNECPLCSEQIVIIIPESEHPKTFHLPFGIKAPVRADKLEPDHVLPELIKNNYLYSCTTEDIINLFGAKICLVSMGTPVSRYVFETMGFANAIFAFFPILPGLPRVGKITGTTLQKTYDLEELLEILNENGYNLWFNTKRERDWLEYMDIDEKLYLPVEKTTEYLLESVEILVG